jgi:hypothetical protein
LDLSGACMRSRPSLDCHLPRWAWFRRSSPILRGHSPGHNGETAGAAGAGAGRRRQDAAHRAPQTCGAPRAHPRTLPAPCPGAAFRNLRGERRQATARRAEDNTHGGFPRGPGPAAPNRRCAARRLAWKSSRPRRRKCSSSCAKSVGVTPRVHLGAQRKRCPRAGGEMLPTWGAYLRTATAILVPAGMLVHSLSSV